MSRFRLVVATSCAAVVAGVLPGSASAFNPGVVCHPLQEQIDAAATNDTIGIATAYPGCHVDVNNKSLTFDGTTANAGFTGSDGSYPSISASGTGTVVIRDLTFRNASNGGSNGGALLFSDNTTPRVINSKFFGNHAPGSGGAIAVFSSPAGPVLIEDSTFGSATPGQGNSAYFGGAVAISSTGVPVTLLRNTFTGNSADQTGGGLRIFSTGDFPVTISGNAFVGNHAVTGGGGADLLMNGRLSLTKSRFISNRSAETAPTGARRMGGGLSAAADGGISQSDNLFKRNVLSYNMAVILVDSGGGGEWVNPGGQLSSRRDRFVGNSTVNSNSSGAETGGGGLYVFGCGPAPATARLADFVATGNHVGTPGDGSGVYDGCGPQPVNLQVLDSTIAANTGGGQIDGGPTDTLQVKNSIIAPAPGTAAINGFVSRAVEYSDTCRVSGSRLPGTGNICANPRLKNAGAGDVHQTSKSPTRDRGSNSRIPAGLTTDFEGGKRITDAEPNGTAPAAQDPSRRTPRPASRACASAAASATTPSPPAATASRSPPRTC